MTTVSLSVCYGGAKPLGPCGHSNFVPCGSPVGHTRGVRGPKSTVPSSAILIGSMAAKQSYRALGTLTPEFPVLGGGFTRPGPYAGSMSFLFIIIQIPFLVGPFVSARIPCFVPQEKKSARCCRFESLSDSGFIAPNLAFYRPYKAQTDI